ncbi:MAG: glycoside hydrolase family 30 protein [Armatimonadota bacterium]
MLSQWISTTPASPWQEREIPRSADAQPDLQISGERYQTWQGFGGCFNELGWVALSGLDTGARDKVIAEIFDPVNGCRFNLCRMPIGASDYAAEWYSLDETPGDFALEHFSIARDRNYLILYIKSALALRSDLRLFASPWSPPTWMKFPRAYNYGTFIWQPEYLDAYARYFLKFVQAYQDEGITINQVHVQNEPVADQKFPSCVWTGTQMRDFIRDHIGPLFQREQPECPVWLGTLNTDDYDGYTNTVLSDPQARQFVGGVGYQWAGKGAIQRTYESWPEVPLMQTENECGDGQNTWDYARYIFNLVRHYISNGVEGYAYWNMVLQQGGLSTWGWQQNAMVTVDPTTKQVTYNPEFYVMKHFSRYIAPGAVRLGLRGALTGDAVAFANPDGSTVVVVANHFAEARKVNVAGVSLTLEGQSFNTLVFSG